MKKKSCPILGCVPGWGLEQPLEAGIRWILRFFPPKPVWDPVEQRADFQLEQLCYKNIGKGRCTPCCSCREFSRSICSREIPKEKQGELFPSMRKTKFSLWIQPGQFHGFSKSHHIPEVSLCALSRHFPSIRKEASESTGRKIFRLEKHPRRSFFFLGNSFVSGKKTFPPRRGFVSPGGNCGISSHKNAGSGLEFPSCRVRQ